MLKYYKAVTWGFTVAFFVCLFTNLWIAICLSPIVVGLWLIELIKGY